MSFDAMDFLAGLFGDTPVLTAPAATVAPVPGPESQEAAPAAAGSPAADAPALGPPDSPGDQGGGVQPQGQPAGEALAAVSGGQPQALADVAGDLPDAPDFAEWVRRPDASGRLGWEPPDLPEVARWWANLPAAGEPLPAVLTAGDAPSFPGDHDPAPPCRRCGSLELWWDLLGGIHCQHCDRAAFERSGRLLEQAERLRRRGLPKKSEVAC